MKKTILLLPALLIIASLSTTAVFPDDTGNQQHQAIEQTCSICFEDLAELDTSNAGVTLTCAHNNSFCTPCISRWSMGNASCPLCRKPITDANQQLFLALEKNNIRNVQKALKQGARLDAQNKHGHFPLTYAAGHSTLRIVRLLLDTGAPVNGPTVNDSTPLMFAAICGKYRIAQLLLEHGADAHVRIENGSTALFYARYYGYPQIAELILQHL